METCPREAHLRRVELRKAELRRELDALFPEPTRLTLEIGSGHGHWLVDYATRFPERRCLGIDIVADRVERARRKAERSAAGNVSFLKAEAMETLELLPASARIEVAVALFPDPWPKKRHWKNRLVAPGFLEALARRCAPSARFHVRTDDPDYFDWIMEVVESQDAWRLASAEPWPLERETVFQARATAYRSATLVNWQSE